MSIASAISALQSASSDIASAISAKGVTVPSGSGFGDYASLIGQIETGGGTLPYDAQVDYLEGTGTQYINTGVYPNSTFTFATKVAATQASANIVYWGVRNSGTGTSTNQQCFLNSNSSGTANAYSKKINLYSTNSEATTLNWSSDITPVVGTMYTLKNMTVVSTMATMQYPVTLFAFNAIGNILPSLGKCRIGRWTAYSNGVVVADFIPVRVGQVGYMYNQVNKQLYGNNGSGSFVVGSDSY